LENEGYVPDLIVLLQPTSPLRKSKTIDVAIDEFAKKGHFDSLIPLKKVSSKIGKIKDGIYVPSYRLGKRRQDLESVYIECGTVFLFRPKVLKDGKLFGDKVYPFVIKEPAESIDVDTLEDLELAEYYLNKDEEI
jgi:CMP-N-acetylneuraminic acid synthetase